MNCGVIYARYSCDKQTENSILGQVRECQEYAKKNGIDVIRVYKDEAKSGRETKNRHEFLQMIRDASERLFNYVIVWKGDRFSRSRADSAKFKSELKRLGVTVLSATEANVTGPEAVLMDGINEAFAEYFSVELAAKVSRGMTQNAIDGKFNGGCLPVGYYLGPDRKIQIDENEAQLIREIFTTYADEDISVSELCKRLKAKGMARKNGTYISKNAMITILRNKKYIGIYEFMTVTNKTMFPPIIDEVTFKKVENKMKKNLKLAGRFTAREVYLLTGRLVCGDCGKPMSSYAGTDRKGYTRRYYRCCGTRVDTPCANKPLRKELIEKLVMNEIIGFLNEDKNIDLIIKCLMKYQENGNPELKETKAKIDDLDKKIERLNYAIAEGIDFKSTIDQLKEYKKTREELCVYLDELKIKERLYRPETLRLLMKQLSTERIETEEGRKKLIAMLINKVIVYSGGKIQIVFNVLNDSQPVIRESWRQALNDAVHHTSQRSTLLFVDELLVGLSIDIKDLLIQKRQKRSLVQ